MNVSIDLLKPLTAVAAAWFYWYFYKRTYYSGQGKLVSTIAFFSGMVATGIALVWEAFVFDFFQGLNPFLQAFLFGALPEESAKAILAIWYLRKTKNSSNLADGLYFGLTLGASFGCIENVFYSFKLEFWPGLLRAGTSLPLHAFTGGILGFFLLRNFQIRKASLSGLEAVSAFLGAVLLHTFYNRLLAGGETGILWIPLLLGVTLLALEFLIAQAEVSLPFELMQAGGLFLDDYSMIQKFTRYDSWLRKTQNFERVETVRLFRSLFSPGRTLIAILLFGIPLFCLNFYLFAPHLIPFYLVNIDFLQFIALFMEYPAWLGVLFLFRGFINPAFFQERILKVPLFLSVTLGPPDKEEPTLAYSLSRRGFYSPLTQEPILEKDTEVSFYIAGKNFQAIRAVPVWKNFRQDDPNHEGGALFRFPEIPWSLVAWRWLVRIRQQVRNLLDAILSLRASVKRNS
ncbi:PrsW family intramembrane metalloprotease [Leptospira fluminis]|uniref:PrsW family intramembrane metalloprotease n=1 Tax=Leptospira fluminis TaxID=2484979 RepID=A0A4R9GQK8_9LEPT|nr:PrsW family glutamic-type intramembrane protease [Leptospira fluminis]TGK20002.1 PrsW family intramembrane metalloprotease [Leptospira fluminis]